MPTRDPSSPTPPVGASGSGTSPRSGLPARPLRADAARNRALLLRAATDAFRRHGVEVPLEEVARSAGVGIGTLYRHFPTRCDLVLAAYSAQVEAVEQRAVDLAAELPPADALHAWMHGFVEFHATKMGLSNLLRQMTEGHPETFQRARAQLLDAAEHVLAPAVDAGVVRPDATATELLRALGGICLAASAPNRRDSTSGAVVDLVFDGLRYGAPVGTGAPPAAATHAR